MRHVLVSVVHKTLPGLGAPVPVCGPIGLEGILSTGGGECPGRRDGPDGQGQTGSARRTGPDGHALQASFADERRIPCPGTFFRKRPPPSDTFLFPPGLHRSGTAYAVFGTFQKWLENFLSFLWSALSCGNFSLVSAGELSQQREKEKTSEHRAASTLEKAFETFSFSVYIRE